MPVSHWYNTFENPPEAQLIDDLINECVGIVGVNFQYIARDLGVFDKIYGEDDQSTYSQTWLIKGYLKSIFGYSGGGDLMTKFGGVEIKDQIIVSIPVREFMDEIGEDTGFIRPREGDLFFFPQHKKVFQINFVNQMEFFYPLGRINTWECTADLFTYSGEKFNTGIEDIDSLQKSFTLDIFDWALKDENGIPLMDENGDYLVVDQFSTTQIDALSDTEELNKTLGDVLDFSEDDPFGDFTHRKI
jgi:hypothetical protein